MGNTRDLEDFLSPEQRQALERPTGDASGLPGKVYSDPEFLDLERRTLFRTTWVATAVSSQIPDPGDVLPVDVVGWAIILVRGSRGEINAFHNVCRHRNATIINAPSKKLAALRCPWHGWTYALDGSFKGSPEFGGVGIHETDTSCPSQLGLVPIRTAQWFDIVFINVDGEAPPLNTYLSRFLKRFDGVGFDTLAHMGSWESSYPCNWKLAVESGIEDYHLPFLHPTLTNGAFRGDRSVMESDEDVYFCCCEVSRSQWSKGRGDKHLPALPIIPGLQGEDAFSLFFLNLFPTAVIGLVPDSLYVGIWLPDGHDKTKLSFHHYCAGQSAMDEKYQPTRDNIIDAVKSIFAQDSPILETVQRQAASRDEFRVESRFSPFWETLVHGFQKSVIKHIENGSRRP